MNEPSDSPCLKHACSACCHDTEMPLTEEDATRLEGLGHTREAFSRVVESVLMLRTDPERAGPLGAPCFFLHDGRCAVYADRPAGCRVYPFILNESRRVTRDLDCPHRMEFKPDATTQRRLLRIVGTIEREARDRA